MYRFKKTQYNKKKVSKNKKESADKTIMKQEISAPSAFSVRSPWGYSIGGLTPDKLSNIIENSNDNESVEYLKLAEEIEEKDWHYRNAISTRKLSVASITPNVMSPGEDEFSKKITEEIQQLTYSPRFSAMLYALMDAISKGYSVAEIVWKQSAEKWVPVDYIWRDPTYFKYDRKTGNELLLVTDKNPMGEPLAPYKFVVHSPSLKMGLPIRSGLARLAMLGWVFKRATLLDWQVFANLYGKPIKIGRYPNSAGKKEQDKLEDAIARLSQDSGMTMPDSMMVELHDAFSGSGSGEVFQNLAKYIDEQVSKCVLGQTMSADNGSSLAQALVHNEVRKDLVSSDGQQLANTLNASVVKYYIDLNYGPQEKYPEIVIKIAEKDDMELIAKALPPFIDRGFEVPEYYLREMFKIPEIQKDDKVIGAAKQPASQLSQNKKVVTMEAQQASEIDTLIEAALADWEPMLNPIFDPIKELIDKSESLEEVKKGLSALLNKMDANKIVQSLATQTFIARGIGDAKDPSDA
jgi:phage gp29-like protein